MSGSSVSIQFVRSTLSVARSYGLDVDQILDAARISPELVRLDSSRVTATQATDLLQTVWRLSGDEMLGLAPRPIPRGTFRMICLAVIHSSDLRTALQRTLGFMALSAGFGQTRIIERDGRAIIEVESLRDQQVVPVAYDILLALLQRFSAWLIGRRIALLSLEMPYPQPKHDPEYDAVFGLIPRFDRRRASISFDVRYLDAPVVRDEADLMEFLRNAPADLLFRRDYGTTVSYKVRRILEHSEPNQRQSADAVARRLAISTQHMRRLLQEEGTSFRQLREDILRDAAISSLTRGGESVDELSARLGFSEPSAFRRAFTRWTGTAPGAYRSADAR